MEFAGRVAIVTGAAHGFGRAIALRLGTAGAKIACCDIVQEELAETAQMLKARDVDALIRPVDVRDETQVNGFVRETLDRFGQIDILVNNAGGVIGQRHVPVDQVPTASWRDMIESNLYGTFFFTRAVAGPMKARRTGWIVNISSGAGRSRSRTNIQGYTAAKAGVIGFTRQTAWELGPYGILVNSVAPGLVMTTPEAEQRWMSLPEAERVKFEESVALRRLGRAEEIAEAVAFLASPRASYISGQVLGVDGGHWMI